MTTGDGPRSSQSHDQRDIPGGGLTPWRSDELGDGTAGGGDLLLGGAGDGVDRHLQRHGDLALAEDLDEAVLANGTLGDETLDGDLATLRVQRAQLVEVHDLELGLERVTEALQLRKAHVEGHLATLEALRNLVTGLRALGTTTSRLTLRRLTTTDTGLGGLGARGGTEVVDLERVVLRHDQSTSSTVTRWRTVCTMPRNSG